MLKPPSQEEISRSKVFNGFYLLQKGIQAKEYRCDVILWALIQSRSGLLRENVLVLPWLPKGVRRNRG